MARHKKKKKARLQGAHALAAQGSEAGAQPQENKAEKKAAAGSPYNQPWSKRSIWILMGFALLVMSVFGFADWLIHGYPLLALPVDCLSNALFVGGVGILIVGKPIRGLVKEARPLRLVEMLALTVIWSVIAFLFLSSILVSIQAEVGTKINPVLAPVLNPQPNYVSAFLLANLICIWIMNFIYRHLPPSLYGKAN